LAAERSLRRALDLDPEQTDACLLYGQLLEAQGKLESGLAMKRKALELEPRSPLVHFSISLSYWNQRRYEETIEWANKTLTLDLAHPHAREFLAGAYLKKGDFNQWLEENMAHAQLHGVPAAALEPLREAYASGGRTSLARLFVERASHQPQAFPPMQLASITPKSETWTPPSSIWNARYIAAIRAWCIWRWRRSGTACARTLGFFNAWDVWD
jgi:tetratricopeptide (TPR) repeat protein